ncbi:MAG: hypothetical protein J6Z41_02145 [Prevotella sp.]|nr:hypothetical protein [Prevotella sp.]
MIKLLLILLFFVSSMTVTAQETKTDDGKKPTPVKHYSQSKIRKMIDEARGYVKTGKNLDKAEKLMTTLLQDSTTHNNVRIYATLAEIAQKDYDIENEKLYLNQKSDTATVFRKMSKLFKVRESLDSAEQRFVKMNNVKEKFRERNAAIMDKYRPNLYYGGLFFLRKSDYNTAYDFFRQYIECDRQPLFSGYDYIEKDSLMSSAAYWTIYCGYQLKDADKTLKYRELGLSQKERLPFALHHLAETYLMRKDTTNYVKTLKEGFSKFPSHTYFFPRIVEYYDRVGMIDTAMVITDEALKVDPDNVYYKYAKSSLLVKQGDYIKAASLASEVIEQDSDIVPEAWYVAGIAYFNHALEIDHSNRPSREVRKRVNSYYEKSRPYMEHYRSLAPERKEQWGPVLYNIYLNLNMGAQFEEMERIMKE